MPGRGAPAGPTPALGLSYDSTAVDGLTSSTNNQASTVGDGWALTGLGSITQKFMPCMDQKVSKSYDLCGNKGGQAFTISFGGRSGQLVKDAASGKFVLQNDDNTKIEYLKAAGQNGSFDGGYWKLTDTAGTQYFFGRNKLPGWATGKPTTNSVNTVPVGAADSSQQCSAASFGASLCQQAAAWNLDYVVDVNGNSQAVYYTQDTNYYASQAGTGSRLSYVRTSRPARVDYGMRAGAELNSNAAPLQYVLSYTGRCTGVDCGKGNDIPTGFTCTATGTCGTQSPTFYSDQRLQMVTTKTLVGTAYQDVDRWTLAHSMPAPGDGTKPALWLASVTHAALDTTGGKTAITDAPVVFSGQALQNRVWVVDGQAPLDRYRISGIKLPTGGVVSVSYLGADCTPSSLPASPETNTRRCYPAYWSPTTPIPQPARMDYFHIYPVAAIGVSAGPGGGLGLLTRYQYLGTPAWKYPSAKYQSGEGGSQLTWSVFAGYSQVKTTTGNNAGTNNPTSTVTYLRGLDRTPSNTSGGTRTSSVTTSNGTVITDSPWFAGQAVETQSFLGDTATRLSSTVTVPWASDPTATDSASGTTARHFGVASSTSIQTSGQTAPPISGKRSRTTTYSHDGYGRTTAVSQGAQTGFSDASCTLTSYTDNTGANLLAFPATSTVRAGECVNGGSNGTVLSATRTLYDSSTSAEPGSHGYSAPTKGLVTKADTATDADGGTVSQWQQGPVLGYDALGRVVSSTDNSTGDARVTKTAFTPAVGLATTVTDTNPLGWTSSTTFDAARGSTVSTTDVNGGVATSEYDAAGRLLKQWSAMRPKATYPTPDLSVTYSFSQTAPSWIRTDTVNATGATYPGFKIFDGLGRLRQTQRTSPPGGVIAADVFYDTTGQVSRTNNEYLMTGSPSGTLLVPTVAVPSSSTRTYDAAGRPASTSAIAYDNTTLSTTSIAYGGADTTTTTGPTKPGKTPSASASQSISDLGGQVLVNRLFKSTTASGASDDTVYSYDTLGRLTSMKDAAGSTWKWTHDVAGRETSAVDPDTGTVTSSYDANGRLSSTKDALGVVASAEYDSLDRTIRTKVQEPGKDPKTLLEWSYDSAQKGQVTSETRYNGSDYDQPVVTSYAGYNSAGQPATVTTSVPSVLGSFAGTYTHTMKYKPNGKVSSLAMPAMGGLPAETIGFGYDGFDNDSSVSSSTGDTIAGNTQYNSLGKVSSFRQSDLNEALSKAPTVGATTTVFTWDAQTGRLAQQESSNLSSKGTVDLGKTVFSYDAAGKLTNRAMSWAGRPNKPADNQCYAYDYADRLASVWTPAASCGAAPAASATSVAGLGGLAPYAQTYAFTAGGDRAQVKRFGATGALASTETYSYQAGTHRLSQVVSTPASGSASTQSFAWDVAGRMTGRAGQTLKYSADGKITGTSGKAGLALNPNPNAAGQTPGTSASGDSSRFYTAAGDLIGIKDATGVTLSLGAVTAFAPVTGAASATRSYSFLGKTVAQRSAKGGVVQYAIVVGDGVGTAQTLVLPTTGTAGITTVARYTDPYGLIRGPTQQAVGTAALTAQPVQPAGSGTNAASQTGFGAVHGYLGKLADTQSSLTHVGARDYDPALGVFTAPDPVLETTPVRGSSPYAYAGHDPINYSDPSGLEAWCGVFALECTISWAAGPEVGVAVNLLGAAATAGMLIGVGLASDSAPPAPRTISNPVRAAHPAVTASPYAHLNFGFTSVATSSGGYSGSIGGYQGYNDPGSGGGQGYGDPGVWLGGGAAAAYGASQAAEAAQRAAAAAAAARAAGLAENARLKAASEAATASLGKEGLAAQAAGASGSSPNSNGAEGSAAAGGALPPDDDEDRGGYDKSKGIRSYREQRKETAGKKGEVQAHHLVEQRFKEQMGGGTNEWPTIVVTRAEHQVFTNAWRQLIGYGRAGYEATPAQVRDAAKIIYDKFPEILKALGLH